MVCLCGIVGFVREGFRSCKRNNVLVDMWYRFFVVLFGIFVRVGLFLGFFRGLCLCAVLVGLLWSLS